MMIEEFTARTGYTPTYTEYRNIEQQYCDFNGDKDAFCQMFCAEFRIAQLEVVALLNKLLVEEAETAELHTPRFLAIKQILMSIDY